MRSRFAFYFREALRSLSTNKATSFAAVIAMLVALMIVGITTVGFLKARSEGRQIQQDAGIVKVFLNETASETQVNSLRAVLEKNVDVKSVTYVSKEDALKRAQDLFKDSPDVIENIPGNPFPKSLEALLVNPQRMDAVAKSVTGQPGVDEVKTGGENARKAINVIQWGTVTFFAIGIGILIAATVLVANTIRLSIYSRRREIEVMKLVGASNSFVRMPFMIEGFLCGVFASVLAMIAVVGTVKLLSSSIGGVLDSNTLGSQSNDVSLMTICFGLLGLGVALGMIGSATSMRKYLRT